MTRISIKKALISDAKVIAQLHYDAVHKTASQSYTKGILNDWSNEVTSDRISKLEETISKNPEGELMIVVEINNKIVGFGSIVPEKKELHAV
jgi:predicted RNA-binding protein with PUA domain